MQDAKYRQSYSESPGRTWNKSENQEECEKSWAISHSQSLSGTPAPYCMLVLGWDTAPRASPLRKSEKEKERMLRMVRQPLESSFAFASKVSHALQRDQTLKVAQLLLVDWGWPPVHGAEQVLC